MKSVSCAAEAAEVLRPAFSEHLINTQECFVVLCLNSKNEMIGEPLMVAMGTANAVEVHPRDVFRQAVKNNAVAIIVAHNHPSGNTKPSSEDINLTNRLRQAGDILGIPILDHLIIDEGKFESFANRGFL
jgi:DNA repair protein RadC